MIPFTEALERLQNAAVKLPVERVSLAHANQRILAAPILADRDLPPFPKAAMDGYALQTPQKGATFSIVAEQMAGEQPVSVNKPRECIKIMTGAHVHSDLRYVIPFEEVDVMDGGMKQVKDIARSNICQQGEDVKQGEVLVDEGTLVCPQHIGLMASVGVANPLVSCWPSVGVLSTGDELVGISDLPNQQQIRNSNGIQLCAQLQQIGITAVDYGIVKDEAETLEQRIAIALKAHDVVLLSGGVSKGDKDYVPAICESLGVEELFHGISVKPGRPTYCGRKEKTVVIGLPGNPVSVFVQFELLVKPFLYKLMGHDYQPEAQRCKLSQSYQRKNAKREVWIPVKLDDKNVFLSRYNGSGDQVGLARSNGLMHCPAGVYELKKGDYVTVRSI